jgi:16S rRNA C967 or C1407 C5-methylase (RsmB/RsmF family)
MQHPFRNHHILQALHDYEKQSLPMDSVLRNYLRQHTAIGSKDRTFIADTIYSMIRWQGLLDQICTAPLSWEKRLEAYFSDEFTRAQKDESLPPYVRVSFPKELFDLLSATYGESSAENICRVSNTSAPITVRANTLKISRDDLLARWKDRYQVVPCHDSSCGITFRKRENFLTFIDFKEGLFEVQDEGSQLLAALVQPTPGNLVLDFCAGAGGKTLAFAPTTQGKGQIYLHDVRPKALAEARIRLKRAGIQNAQTLESTDEKKLKSLKKKMDWVLVDAPCSGVGTLRRNPDMKWRFNVENLKKVVGQQRTIFEKALSFLSPNGHIVYATCSLLREENEEQTEHFLKTYPLELVKELKTLPAEGGMDGFYGVVFKLRNSQV